MKFDSFKISSMAIENLLKHFLLCLLHLWNIDATHAIEKGKERLLLRPFISSLRIEALLTYRHAKSLEAF